MELTFELPLGEVVFDFYDKLKIDQPRLRQLRLSPDRLQGERPDQAGHPAEREKVDALSALIHRDHAHELGKKMCSKLKELLPRQQFDIPIQAAIGAKIVARETVKALRKDVTAKCYGGDISAGSASCWRSRRKARSACARSAAWRFRRMLSWRC